MIRVVHYVNQFFAGIGGEDRAGEAPGSKPGTVGPGLALQSALGQEGQVVATVWCGDNFMAEHGDQALAQVVALIAEHKPDLVVAGPAFASGRYGLACGQVVGAVRHQLGIAAITGMHESNPAVDVHRRNAVIVPTRDSAAGMREAMGPIARIGLRLGRGETLGPALTEGYFPTGRRVNAQAPKRGAYRAAQMLLNRIKQTAFQTESELPHYDTVVPANPVTNIEQATVALVTEGGCVPKGNPDAILSSWATHWVGYSLDGLQDLKTGDWQYIHGGYDTVFVDQQPDRCVPLDSLRDLEASGRIGKIYERMLSTCGNMAPLSTAVRFGQEMAQELKRENVQAAILTAT